MIDTVLYTLDILGVAVFAASGALKASQRQMDIFGFILVAAVTGIGGGTLRDLILGIRPVFWVERPDPLIICAGAAAAVFFVAHRLQSRQRWLVWADAVGLATFCVLGTQVALNVGAPPLVAVLMGVMTASFGGILRDVVCGEVPLILQREIYATAAAAGSLVVVGADSLGVPEAASVALGFSVALACRAAGIVFGWSLPSYQKPGAGT